jgi:RNA-directed DNA polymerase
MSSFTRFVRRAGDREERRSPEDWYRLREEKRRARERSGLVPSLEQIADPENLIRVFGELKRHAGQAPGEDGLTYLDLSASEVGSCMRGLSQVVLRGKYRPSPSRLVQIPKAGGKGQRTLALRNILDRVIAAALNTAMTPFWETLFLPGSMGFRPNRGPWDMLIRLEKAMVEEGRWVLAIDDVKDAFDHVNLEDLMEDHRRHLQDEKLLDLIEVVLRGGSNQDRKEGIEQGNAYSPTCLNVRLHHVHDLGLNQDRTNPSVWFRYADNLAYLAGDVPEGLQVLQRSRALLQSSGFTLKGEDGPPVNLREGQEAHLLGFLLSYRDGQVVYGLDEDAWKGLEQNLERCHEMPNPPLSAAQAIQGWVGLMGLPSRARGERCQNESSRLLSLMAFRRLDLLRGCGESGSCPGRTGGDAERCSGGT